MKPPDKRDRAGALTEGYCATCRFMIDLTEDGRLAYHGSRTVYANGAVTGRTDACEATGTHPSPTPGTEDPAAAFTSEARVGRCPVCKSEDAVAHEISGRAYMIWHRAQIVSQESTVCPGTWDPIEYT